MTKISVADLKSVVPCRRAGFTILELLVVISIMAVIATLATGAVVKAIRQGRVRRVEASCRALEMALMNYRAQEGKWSFKRSDLVQQTDNRNKYWAHGENNKKVFKDLYQANGQEIAYLDASALLALQGGQRVPLRVAIQEGDSDVALIYPDPNETSKTRFYCVEYRVETDSVVVHTQTDHTCPE